MDQSTIDDIRAQFKRFDLDGSGTLDKDDMSASRGKETGSAKYGFDSMGWFGFLPIVPSFRFSKSSEFRSVWPRRRT